MIRQALGDRLKGDVVSFLRNGEQVIRRTLTINGEAVGVEARRTAADDLLERLGLVVVVNVQRIITDKRPADMIDEF